MHEEGLEAWIASFPGVDGADLETMTAMYEAAIRYRRTGEPQPVPDLQLPALLLMFLYDRAGQFDRAADFLNTDMIQAGAGPLAAFMVVRNGPRYQALLEEAEIAW